MTYVLLSLSPLYPCGSSAQLACLIHAANVHSEPGSNPSIVLTVEPKRHPPSCCQPAVRPSRFISQECKRSVLIRREVTPIQGTRLPPGHNLVLANKINLGSLPNCQRAEQKSPVGSDRNRVPTRDSAFYRMAEPCQPLETKILFRATRHGLTSDEHELNIRRPFCKGTSEDFPGFPRLYAINAGQPLAVREICLACPGILRGAITRRKRRREITRCSRPGARARECRGRRVRPSASLRRLAACFRSPIETHRPITIFSPSTAMIRSATVRSSD